LTTRKYIAQILLEVELEAETYFGAETEAEYEAKYIIDTYRTGHANILNTHIIQSPSDEEFLESLCIK
jgi:hypothetical protein